MFGYVPGSYRRIILALLDKLYSENIEIKTNYPVNMIHKNGDSTIHVESPDGLKDEFDKVILTIPSAYVSQICPQISEEEKLRHNNIKYLGVICVSVLLKKSLANYYITNITDDNIPFTGVIEMSALVNKKQFGGNALIYLPKYLSSDDKDFGLSKEVIEQRFLNTLLKMYPHITKDDILATNTAKARYVFALPTLGYSQKLPPITSSLPGLYIINTSHIVNGTLNVNETINLADVSLENIFAKNVDMNSTYRAPEHIQV